MADDEVSVASDVGSCREGQGRRGDREVSGLVDGAVEEVSCGVARQVREHRNCGAAVRERDIDRPEVAAIDDGADWEFELVHDEVISIATRIAGLAGGRVRRIVDAVTRARSNARCEGRAAGQADCSTSQNEGGACKTERAGKTKFGGHGDLPSGG